MSEKKISELNSTDSINSTDVLVIVQNNITKKVKVEKLLKKIENSYIGDEYNSTQTYAVGDYCIHDNTLYKCTTEIVIAEEWNAEHWTAVTIKDELDKKFDKNNIVDSLNSTSTTDGLSANQGRILNESRIVDVVSNSYGTAYKYGNGLMVCAMRYNVNATIAIAWGNAYISSEFTSKNYPVAFASTPIYQINVEPTSGDGAWIMNANAASKTKPSNFYLLRGNTLTNSTTFTINVYAIGNWK